MSTFGKSLLIVACIWSFPALFLFAAVALDRALRNARVRKARRENAAKALELAHFNLWEREVANR